jgi:hypothetical protein
MITKIIHQTGPTDKSKWHPLWHKCQQSWLSNFKDFEYRFWDDQDIDDLVRDYYPKYYDMYSNFPIHIMKIDFVRFCILHKFGGIYADLDMFCYQNFYNDLQDGPHIIENPFGNDSFENSLMCSRPNEEFFLQCMEKSLSRYTFVQIRYPSLIKNLTTINDDSFEKFQRPYLVFYVTGTNLVSTVARESQNMIYCLPGCVYNNLSTSYDPMFRTKHMHTGVWGKENISIIKDYEQNYQKMRKVDLLDFDFYTDYTNGNYLKTNELDLYKNDIENDYNLTSKGLYF